MPRVSVVIPTYNRAALVVEAVDSVLKQSFQDYEIVVVDNGSTDETAVRLAAFGRAVRAIRLDNRGWNTVVFRNPGIAAARGELIAFLDDDDLWLPDKLERQIALLDSDGAIGFVYSDLQLLYPDGALSEPVLPARHWRGGAVLDELLAGCFISCSTLVVRRRLLDRVGWFDETLAGCEDYDLLLRLAAVAKAGCVAAPLALRRLHQANASVRTGIGNYQNAIFVLERFVQRAKLSPRQRFRARRTLARWYAHVGLALAQAGDRSAARAHFAHSLRRNPFQRRAWIAFAQCSAPRSP
jgi:glycosyltransferase involved in cell wall biosynthesis